MAIKACKLLREVDGYFNDGIVDEGKFDSKKSYFEYKCPYDKESKVFPGCKNNNERINALGGDLYNKLVNIANDFKGEGDNGNRHIEIFMMWLGDKLYKLENNKTAILEESYKNYLDSHTGNFKYWNIVGSKKEYKIANVWYMSELYNLLNCICNIVIEYKKNPNSREIGTMSKKCHQKFTSIYKDIKDCYSYFHLLKFLKNIYDGIRNDAIKKDNDLKATIRKAAARNAAIRSDIIKKIAIPPQIKSSKQILEYVLNASTVSLIDLTTSDWDQRFPNESDRIIDFNTQKCVNSYHEFVEQVKKEIPKDTPTTLSQPGSDKPGKEGNNKPPNQQAETSPQPLPVPGKEESQPNPQPSVEPSEPPTQSHPSSSSSQNDTSLQTFQTGEPNKENEPPDSGNSKGNTGGASDNKGAPSDGNENPGDGTSDPLSSTPGGSFDFGSLYREFLLNGTKFYYKAFQFIKDNRQKIKDARDQISDAYNNTMINLKNVYDKSSSYFSDIISNITNQLSQVDPSSKPGNSGNNMPQNNDKSQKGGDSPQLPSKGSPIKDPSPNPQPTLSLPKHPSPQLQSTTLQNPQDNPSNQKRFVQLEKSLSSDPNLRTPWNILPTTWNGSMDCKPKINFINTTIVCCTYEQCSLTGISVTLVLIPIILLIAYKCLSFGSSKKSEKKNMKRVINLSNGSRKTQIIINSYDRSKDLKPVINSVGRKKYLLLNIYKLMQADPVPFINLFFLLIFFVYKRKRYIIE
ncbi:CIR protein PIR protein [Plasmodium vinckei lentum]|uniref:CIR protein PIR protein n=1 Tax=Plasmodium vinckei lentum TaxID=138297 RepID=A0A6V7S5P3_PLAVN|nr:CIR protein PIR protein [Plasmodium vinckei lentum]